MNVIERFQKAAIANAETHYLPQSMMNTSAKELMEDSFHT